MKALFLLVSTHLILLAVSRFIAWPENLLWPYLDQNGVNYYRGLFLIYTPFYWWSLSFFYKLFGIGVYQLMAFSWIIILITDILLFFISKKRAWPLLLYIPLQIFFEGNGVWPDHLLAPLFLAAYFFWQSKRFFWLGVFLGLSLMTKQTAMYVVLFIIGMTAWKRQWGDLLKISLGVVIPVLGTVAYLYYAGVLVGFIDSVVKYILLFHSKYPLQAQLPTASQLPVLFILATLVIFSVSKKGMEHLAPWIIFAGLGIFSRFEFFHLQPALPFIALAAGTSRLAMFPCLFFSIFFLRFLVHNSFTEPRFMGKEVFNNGEEIERVLGNEKNILIVNSWDHYYFLIGRLPAGPSFVPSTPWTMDYPPNKEKLRRSLARQPKFIVYNNCFLVKGFCYRPEGVMNALKQYLKRLELPDGTGVFEYHPVTSP